MVINSRSRRARDGRGRRGRRRTQRDPEMSLIWSWIRGITLFPDRSSSCRRGAGVHSWLALDTGHWTLGRWAYPALMIVSRVCAASPDSGLESCCSQDSTNVCSVQGRGCEWDVGCGICGGDAGPEIIIIISRKQPQATLQDAVCRANQIPARRTVSIVCKRASVRTTRERVVVGREQMPNGCWADDVAASCTLHLEYSWMGCAEKSPRTRDSLLHSYPLSCTSTKT